MIVYRILGSDDHKVILLIMEKKRNVKKAKVKSIVFRIIELAAMNLP